MRMRRLQEVTDPSFSEVLMLPFSMTQEQLTEALPATLPLEVMTQLCSNLIQRHFADLWTGPLALFVKRHCVVCHEAMTAPDLLRRLQDVHSLVHHGAAPLIHAIHTAILASLHVTDNTFSTCPLCDLDLTTLVQEHLHNCLVAHQAVLLVHLTQDGRILGRPHAGRHQSGNVRRVQTHVGAPGKGSTEDPPTTKRRRTKQQKAETGQGQWQEQRQAQGQRPQDPPASGDVRESDPGAPVVDSIGSQTRCNLEIHARRQFLRMFPGTTSTRDVAVSDCRDHAVETGLREQEGLTEPAQPIVAACVPDTPKAGADDG